MGSERTTPRRLLDVWPAIAGLAIVFLIEMVDNSILNVALPTIARDLHASAAGLQWINGSYALVFGATMLLFGGLADRFGRRRLLIVGLLLFAATSTAVLTVTTAAGLVAVRAICGLSAAMTAPGTMALSFRLFPDDALRARASAVITGVGMTGLAVGPVLGGVALTFLPWQALLLVNVPVALAAVVAIARGIDADSPGGLRSTPVDVVGGLLGAGALAAVLLTPTLALDGGWLSWRPLLAAAVAALLLVCFLVRERQAEHPLVRLSLLGIAPVRAGLLSQLSMALALAVVGYTVQLQLQYAWGWRPALAAAGSLPQVLAMIGGGFFVEPIVKRLGLARGGLAGALAVVAAVCCYAALSRHGYGWIALAMVILAIGMRLVMITSTIQVMKGLPPDHLSVASALNDTAQELGSATGIAVTGSILSGSLSGALVQQRWDPITVARFDDAVLWSGISLAGVTLAVVVATSLRPVRRAAG